MLLFVRGGRLLIAILIGLELSLAILPRALNSLLRRPVLTLSSAILRAALIQRALIPLRVLLQRLLVHSRLLVHRAVRCIISTDWHAIVVCKIAELHLRILEVGCLLCLGCVLVMRLRLSQQLGGRVVVVHRHVTVHVGRLLLLKLLQVLLVLLLLLLRVRAGSEQIGSLSEVVRAMRQHHLRHV